MKEWIPALLVFAGPWAIPAAIVVSAISIWDQRKNRRYETRIGTESNPSPNTNPGPGSVDEIPPRPPRPNEQEEDDDDGFDFPPVPPKERYEGLSGTELWMRVVQDIYLYERQGFRANIPDLDEDNPDED